MALAAGFGVPARRVSTAADVTAALARSWTGIEVLVVDVDRSGRAEEARRLAVRGCPRHSYL